MLSAYEIWFLLVLVLVLERTGKLFRIMDHMETPLLKRGVFDHERLDVYQLQLQFIAWVTPLIEDAQDHSAGKSREVSDQLDRASLSCLLNTAEGNGKRQRQGRAKFFDDARGSATECAACLDALVAKNVFPSARVAEGKAKLLRIVSMLCGLVDRFDDPGARLHEENGGYVAEPDAKPEAQGKRQTGPGLGWLRVKPVSYRESVDSRTRTRTRTRRTS
jgi:four helix bundle protein